MILDPLKLHELLKVLRGQRLEAHPSPPIPLRLETLPVRYAWTPRGRPNNRPKGRWK